MAVFQNTHRLVNQKGTAAADVCITVSGSREDAIEMHRKVDDAIKKTMDATSEKHGLSQTETLIHVLPDTKGI